jgi:hypothetical protein
LFSLPFYVTVNHQQNQKHLEKLATRKTMPFQHELPENQSHSWRHMNTKRAFLVSLAILVALLALTSGISLAKQVASAAQSQLQAALGTGFSYQGYLTDGGQPANGGFDFYFELFDASTDGTSIMTTTLDDVAVANGLFTVMLDFGAGAFDGDERWLEISVRPESEVGAYTALTDRQQITPAPYALYAVEAGGVDWVDVDNRPAGLDDGDDDTVDPLPVFSNTSVDTTDRTGHESAMAIGSDGLPIIAYRYIGADPPGYVNHLAVAHCNDIACTSAITTTIDTTGRIERPSITIGSDGLAVIAYYRIDGAYDLKVAHCENLACTSATINSPDTSGNVGADPSITIGTDGLPIISYTDVTNKDLKIAYCDDVYCSTATTRIVDEAWGHWSSIAIGVDGYPIISYKEEDSGDLKAAHCENATCTSVISTTLESDGNVGKYSEITIGNDGMPIIVYKGGVNDSNSNLTVAHCNDIACTSATIADLYSGYGYVQGSITIGTDGFPIISFRDNTTDRLMVAHCYDVACTTSSWIIVDDPANEVGQYNSIKIGTDGLPIISHFDNTSGDLKVIHCSNVFCVPYWRR